MRTPVQRVASWRKCLVYNQNFYGGGEGAGLVDGEGVIVKASRNGVVGLGPIEEPFQKLLKIGLGKGKSCS